MNFVQHNGELAFQRVAADIWHRATWQDFFWLKLYKYWLIIENARLRAVISWREWRLYRGR